MAGSSEHTNGKAMHHTSDVLLCKERVTRDADDEQRRHERALHEPLDRPSSHHAGFDLDLALGGNNVIVTKSSIMYVPSPRHAKSTALRLAQALASRRSSRAQSYQVKIVFVLQSPNKTSSPSCESPAHRTDVVDALASADRDSVRADDGRTLRETRQDGVSVRAQ